MNDKNDKKYEYERERIPAVHLAVILGATIIGVSFVLEGLIRGWEFWVPPFILAGMVIIWFVHIRQNVRPEIREGIYVSFILIAALFNGVHENSVQEISFISVVIMLILSQLDNSRFLGFALIEYAVALVCQLFYLMKDGLDTDALKPSSILIYVVIYLFGVIAVYRLCLSSINKRKYYRESELRHGEELMIENQSVEDFLSNISHELRTPINVVLGMSELLLKEYRNEKIDAIRNAGTRLTEQVDDILDFTEISSDRVLISNEKYMVASLVNDVVQSIRAGRRKRSTEFIVDLDASAPLVMIGDMRRIKKIILHLLSNSAKFTETGGIYFRISTQPRDYGVNLDIEVIDTGKGMTRDEIVKASQKLYQTDKGRDRSTGGIGLGLSIVSGFVYKMGGFIKIDSVPGRGTDIKVSIPQKVYDDSPCLSIDRGVNRSVVYYVRPEKYIVPRVRDFYRTMAENLAVGLHVRLYTVTGMRDLVSIFEKIKVTHVFMGSEEYEEDREYFDQLSHSVCVAVATDDIPMDDRGGRIIFIPKPLYAFPLVSILNAGDEYDSVSLDEAYEKPHFSGVRALVVDDEIMNLVVASGLFNDYGMDTDIAESGKEALEKYRNNDYEVIFMDHMMPGMDGVEAMKRLREIGAETGRRCLIIALTANAVSGAREMFMSQGFDGFIAKPIEIKEFESVLKRVLPPEFVSFGEDKE